MTLILCEKCNEREGTKLLEMGVGILCEECFTKHWKNIKSAVPAVATHLHFKGGFYELLHRGEDATNGANYREVVIYRSLRTGKVLSRAATEFDGCVQWPEAAGNFPRFCPIAVAKAFELTDLRHPASPQDAAGVGQSDEGRR